MENSTLVSNDIVNSKLEAVRELYALGFNVLPLYFGSKQSAGNWKMVKATRLPEACLDSQFVDRNVGVLVGQTSRNLFVVDCDTNEAFNYWAEKLHNRGLDKWVVSSFHGGHFWFLSEDGEVKSTYKKDQGLYKPENGYQIWGRNHYVVTPPSIRTDGEFSGFVYSWLRREGELPPVLKASEIEDIFPKVKVIKALLAGRLTPLAYRAIIDHSNKGYPSHSEAEFAAVMSLLRIGWGEDEIVNLFNEYQPPHFAKAKSDERWLMEHMIAPAKAVVRSNQGTSIQHMYAWSRDRMWMGRTGKTDRLVFEACCERAKIEGPYRFRATVREIGELCNQSDKTVNKSIRRLVNDGILKLLTIQKFERVREPNYFSIPEEIQHYHSSETTKCTIPVVLSSEFREHDTWHRYGLGKNALFIYEYLLGMPMFKGETAQEITSALQGTMGMKLRAVETALRRLASVGLAGDNNGMWKANYVKLDRLDEIAERLGVFGKAQKRQEVHHIERGDYALRILIRTQRPPLEKASATGTEIPGNGISNNLGLQANNYSTASA
jgi:hypothetical protein